MIWVIALAGLAITAAYIGALSDCEPTNAEGAPFDPDGPVYDDSFEALHDPDYGALHDDDY
jgi:hypothetical protein